MYSILGINCFVHYFSSSFIIFSSKKGADYVDSDFLNGQKIQLIHFCLHYSSSFIMSPLHSLFLLFIHHLSLSLRFFLSKFPGV